MLIYHVADRIRADLSWGDSLRQTRMLNAFKSTGHDVIEISGNCNERVKQAEAIIRQLEKGREKAIYYGESVNSFIALNWLRERPFHPWQFEYDCKLPGRLRKLGVPTGVFYRDVYWRFDVIPVSFWKRILKQRVRPFFSIRELHHWRQGLDFLFLPHHTMAEHIPLDLSGLQVRSLPPGGDIHGHAEVGKTVSAPLKLLYVGSIKPPAYDLLPYLETLEDEASAELTVVTRKDGLEQFGDRYRFDLRPKVRVRHASEEGLIPFYREADIAVAVREDSDYLSFAMPIKIFEAISHGLPLIVTSSQKSVAELVQKEGIGWVVRDPKEFQNLVKRLANRPDEIKKVSSRVLLVREHHTWQARANEVIKVLSNVQK